MFPPQQHQISPLHHLPIQLSHQLSSLRSQRSSAAAVESLAECCGISHDEPGVIQLFSRPSIPAHRIEAAIQWMLTRCKEIHHDQDDMASHFSRNQTRISWTSISHSIGRHSPACFRYKFRSFKCNKFFGKFVAAPLGIRSHRYSQTLQSFSLNHSGGLAINMLFYLIMISFFICRHVDNGLGRLF